MIALTNIENQLVDEDASFEFVLPEDTFTDVDVDDSLTYTATLADGTPLPTWLNFNGETGTFSGTPLNEDAGIIGVMVTATDLEGATATDTFDLEVSNTNDAPTVTNSVTQQIDNMIPLLFGATTAEGNIIVTEDQTFSYTLAADTFTDVDVDDSLTYTAALADGTPLPDSMSLTFDADTGDLVFSGTPDDNDVNAGSYDITITATDSTGETVSHTFNLQIENIDDAPVLDLNGSDEDDINFLAEGVSPSQNLMSIVDRDLTFTDVDSDLFAGGIIVQIANPTFSSSSFPNRNLATNGFSESLTANTEGTDIYRYYNSNSGTLFLTGEDSFDNYQQVLRSVQYANSLDSGFDANVSLEFGVVDSISDLDLLLGVNNSEVLTTSNISFDADTTISLAEGALSIVDSAGGNTDDEIILSIDPDNNTVQVKTNSSFSVGEGINTINGLAEVPIDSITEGIIVNAGAGNDTLVGSAEVEQLMEVADTDFTLTNDQLTGLGTDVLSEFEEVHLIGGDGNNTMDASMVTDLNVTLEGAAGNDVLTAGANDDVLIGGAGKDILTGGAGGDTFVLNDLTESVSAGGAFDVITDFDIDSDTILAPTAISAENIIDYGVLEAFTVASANEKLGDFDDNEAAIFEFRNRYFLIINDGNAGFDNTVDAVLEITSYTGNFNNLAIGSIDELAMDNSNLM